jgi:hypothetical protein
MATRGHDAYVYTGNLLARAFKQIAAWFPYKLHEKSVLLTVPLGYVLRR